jgi:hypothetical protein
MAPVLCEPVNLFMDTKLKCLLFWQWEVEILDFCVVAWDHWKRHTINSLFFFAVACQKGHGKMVSSDMYFRRRK